MVALLLSPLGSLWGWVAQQTLLLYPLHCLLSVFLRAAEWLRYAGHLPSPKQGKEDQVAEVRRIVSRVMLWKLGDTSRHHFSTFHEGFSGLECLSGSRVALYTVTRTHAYFLRLPRPLSAYGVKDAPFMYEDTFADAEVVLKVSHAALRRAAAACGPLRPRLILISATGRCGSTLLTQMLGALGGDRSLALSEPGDTKSIADLALRIPIEELTEIVRNLYTVYYNGQPVDTVVIKHRFVASRFVEPVRRAFLDQSEFVFMERKSAYRTLESFQRMFGPLGQNRLTVATVGTIVDAKAWFQDTFLGGRRIELLPLLSKNATFPIHPALMEAVKANLRGTSEEILTIMWLDTLLVYKTMRAGPIPDYVHLYYEDLVAEPGRELARLATAFRLSPLRLDDAVACLGLNSQTASSMYGQMKAAFRERISFAPAKRVRIDALLAQLDMPPVDWPTS